MGRKKKTNSSKNDYLYEVNSQDFKFDQVPEVDPVVVEDEVEPVVVEHEGKDVVEHVVVEPVVVEPVVEHVVEHVVVEPVVVEPVVVEPVVEHVVVEPIVVEPVVIEPVVVKDEVEPVVVKDEVEPVVVKDEIKHVVKPNFVNILFTYITGIKNLNLNRWIAYHLSIGFNHIYILNNTCKLDKINCSNELVSIINTNKPIPLSNVMEQSYKFSSRYNFDWMMYLKYNEFLYTEKGNLTEFLMDKTEYDQVLISNRSIVNINTGNLPNSYNNYYYTFSDMSNSFINNNLKNYVGQS